MAEKYAIAQDLDEIIGRYQQEKERGHNAHAVGLAGPDIEKSRQPSHQRSSLPFLFFSSMMGESKMRPLIFNLQTHHCRVRILESL